MLYICLELQTEKQGRMGSESTVRQNGWKLFRIDKKRTKDLNRLEKINISPKKKQQLNKYIHTHIHTNKEAR